MKAEERLKETLVKVFSQELVKKLNRIGEEIENEKKDGVFGFYSSDFPKTLALLYVLNDRIKEEELLDEDLTGYLNNFIDDVFRVFNDGSIKVNAENFEDFEDTVRNFSRWLTGEYDSEDNDQLEKFKRLKGLLLNDINSTCFVQGGDMIVEVAKPNKTSEKNTPPESKESYVPRRRR